MIDISKMYAQRDIVANMYKLGYKWTYQSQLRYEQGDKYNYFCTDGLIVVVNLDDGRFWINRNRVEIASYKTLSLMDQQWFYEVQCAIYDYDEPIQKQSIKFANNIGTVLKQHRKELGISRMYVAINSKIDVVYLDLIERNKKEVCLNTLIRIATVLEVPLLQFEIYNV